MQETEGFISIHGGKVWYKIVGQGKGVPLIIVHGGPGCPHDYLEPHADLATDRPVIFYDQLGCGNSDQTTDPALWTVDTFVEELHQVVAHLKLERFHLLGQSWGATLGIAFALTKPAGLVSLVLADPYLSTPRWKEDAARLLSELPDAMRQALQEGKEETEAFKLARTEYYYRYVNRMPKPLPEPFERGSKKFNHGLYRYMWGATEYDPTGTLRDLDLSPRLPEVDVPTLIACGKYDEATPEAGQYFQSLLPDAKLEVFANSAHCPFWTDRKEYMKVVSSFLQAVESKAAHS